MQVVHGDTADETSDMMRYIISKLLPGPVGAIVTTSDGQRVNGKWNVCRCHATGCNYVNGDGHRVEAHIRNKHRQMQQNIDMLGWFWGKTCTMIKTKPLTTIAEVLGDGKFWECTKEGCHLPFQTEKALKQHFSQIHAAYILEGWRTSARLLIQKWQPKAEESKSESDEANDTEEEEDRIEAIRLEEFQTTTTAGLAHVQAGNEPDCFKQLRFTVSPILDLRARVQSDMEIGERSDIEKLDAGLQFSGGGSRGVSHATESHSFRDI
jgi:hypothetical protein